MTQIVWYVSDDFVVMASDRRVTWDNHTKRTYYEDTENKAVLLSGHLILGYTGFARLENTRTDQWVVRVLSGIDPHEYALRLSSEAERAIGAIRISTARKGHAFVAAGYLAKEEGADITYEPVVVRISNALGAKSGDWQPREKFTSSMQVSLGGRAFWMDGLPALPKDLHSRYLRLIAGYRMRRPGSVTGIGCLLIELIRDVSRRNIGVSGDVSVSILPKSAIPAESFMLHMNGLTDPVTTVACYSSLAGGGPAMHYAPSAVWQDFSMFGAVAGYVQGPLGPQPSAGPPPPAAFK
jgi:hypothetical protein